MANRIVKRLELLAKRVRNEWLFRHLSSSRAFRQQFVPGYAGVVRDLGDHKIIFDPDDRYIGAALRMSGSWFRAETMRVIEAIPSPTGKVFVDIGANIGTQTIYALAFGGFDRAVCFEPMPANLDFLRANLALNNLSDRVIVIGAAVGAQAGRLSMATDPVNCGGHSFHQPEVGPTLSVDIVTLDSELVRLGLTPQEIGLVWMDVEGHEGEVLKGWHARGDVPLCVEYSPHIRRLPNETFANWKRWAVVQQAQMAWRPIEELDLSIYPEGVDLLFA